MKSIMVFITLFVGISKAFAQTSPAQVCGKTQPSFCVNEHVVIGTYYDAKIIGVLATGVYAVEGAPVSNYGPEYMAKTDGCLPASTNFPSVCVGESVAVGPDFDVTVVGIYANGNLAVKGTYTSVLNPNQIASKKVCGADDPSFCPKEPVIIGSKKATVVGVYRNGNYAVSGSYKSVFHRNEMAKTVASPAINQTAKTVEASNPNDLFSLEVKMSSSATDVFNTYQQLSSVVTKERAEFLKAASQYIKTLNHEGVNQFAGMILAKIVSHSTAEVVKQNFGKPMTDYIADLEKSSSIKSIDQIEANAKTLDFATRIIYAGLKLKMTLPTIVESDKADLAQLGKIATMTKLSEKIAALQDYCTKNQGMIEELIQDPRHGVLGKATADVFQWVLNN